MRKYCPQSTDHRPRLTVRFENVFIKVVLSEDRGLQSVDYTSTKLI